MRANRHFARHCLWLVIAPGCWASCATPDQELLVITAPALPAYVQARFKAAEYDCGIRLVELKAREYAVQTDPAGIDNRFVLRNVALDASNDITVPEEKRIGLVKASSTTLLASYSRTVSAEVKYDTLLALKVGKNFSDQKGVGAQLDALLIALRIDRMQTGPERLAKSYEATMLIPQRLDDNLRQLIAIVEVTRDDPPAEWLRSQVAHNLYYSFSARQNLATVDATLNRCKDIVGLINALGDVQPYDHNLPIGWQWRPTMEAGYCYRNVARLEESGKLMNEAIQIARDIKDDNSRLAQLRLVIIELVNIHYERVEVLNLANEMLATASSLDTGIAKDIRESIPRLIANRVNY